MRTSPLLSLRIAAVASILLCASSAFAEAVGNDEVALKNGGSLRGTVVSSEPGLSVKILVMGDKEPRVIPWAEVRDVERDKFAPKPAPVQPGGAGAGYSPPPPPMGPPPPPPMPLMGAPGVVRLHVESPVPVIVHTHATSYGQVGAYGFVIDSARPVCASPCDRVIDGSYGQAFSVGADGVSESRNFTLADRTGDVFVDVSPGGRGLRIGGYWMVVLGVSAIATGATLMALSTTSTNVNPDGSVSSGSDSGELTAGAVVGGAGVASLVGGIVMLVESRTTVDVHEAAPRVGRAARLWAGEF